MYKRVIPTKIQFLVKGHSFLSVNLILVIINRCFRAVYFLIFLITEKKDDFFLKKIVESKMSCIFALAKRDFSM